MPFCNAFASLCWIGAASVGCVHPDYIVLWSPRSLERDLERARADHISEMENLTEKHRQHVSETKKKQWVSWNFSAQLYTSCNILLSSLMTDNRSSFSNIQYLISRAEIVFPSFIYLFIYLPQLVPLQEFLSCMVAGWYWKILISDTMFSPSPKSTISKNHWIRKWNGVFYVRS